jgi:hypothetical protein
MSDVQMSLEILAEKFSGNPKVVEAKWFGKPCLKVDGKAFAVKFGRDLAFKLTGDAHSEALKIEGAKLFDPRGKGSPFKEWVQVPIAQSSTWLGLAEKAYDYVNGLT